MQNKGNTNYQKNFGSAVLFALAILILVVSCPLKSLLTNNFVAQTSIPSKSKQSNNNHYSRILYSSHGSGCAANYESPVLQSYESQIKKIPIPFFTLHIFTHTGYHIHPFPDGIKTAYCLTPDTGNSSLPLFLQHRSLLI